MKLKKAFAEKEKALQIEQEASVVGVIFFQIFVNRHNSLCISYSSASVYFKI